MVIGNKKKIFMDFANLEVPTGVYLYRVFVLAIYLIG
jgi:hypothetical protein